MLEFATVRLRSALWRHTSVNALLHFPAMTNDHGSGNGGNGMGIASVTLNNVQSRDL
jgi:hypothetical protein